MGLLKFGGKGFEPKNNQTNYTPLQCKVRSDFKECVRPDGEHAHN